VTHEHEWLELGAWLTVARTCARCGAVQEYSPGLGWVSLFDGDLRLALTPNDTAYIAVYGVL
jgi:hypothetical protein